MTEQQFLQDPFSSSESEVDTADESKHKKSTTAKDNNKKQVDVKQNLKNKKSYGNSSGEENSQTEEDALRSDLEEDDIYGLQYKTFDNNNNKSLL